MSWDTHPDVLYALELAEHVINVDGDPAERNARMSAIRQLVKEMGRTPEQSKRMFVAAALGMVAAGLPPNAGDIAWFVRDRSIGHPERPSFAPSDKFDFPGADAP